MLRWTHAHTHFPRSSQIAFVVYVSVVPIGMPVVTGAVLAAGAREMVAEKAIVSRQAHNGVGGWGGVLAAALCGVCEAAYARSVCALRRPPPSPKGIHLCRLSALEEMSGMEILCSGEAS